MNRWGAPGARLRIRDLGGKVRLDRKVGEGKVAGTSWIPLPGFPPGLFALEIRDGGAREGAIIRKLP